MTTQTTRPRAALDQQLLTTGFEIPPDGVNPTRIDYIYDTMPGNRPSAYGNKIYIWETSGHDVPRNQPYKNENNVTSDRPDGDGTFPEDVTNLSYLLGYATGPAVENVCATVFVPALGAGDPVIYPPSITLERIGTNVVTFSYSMPGGSQPMADNDWVGLWEKQSSSALYSLPPKWFAQIPENSAKGAGALQNVRLLRATSYILGYFKGGYSTSKPKQSTLACSLTFQT
ncbi:hypothetical protein [Spirillospora sp. NPDC029432]|uniref:hypothetical protein n=1 Tax=Spirillospora sp. NPDC029432 TaxID=3154599 RepID=UPI00345529CC